MQFKRQSEIRTNKLQDPAKTHIVLERSTLNRLKAAALYEDTTVNEILRCLAEDYLDKRDAEWRGQIFYRIYYGIAKYDSQGHELAPRDEMYAAELFRDVDIAISHQQWWLDQMVNEVKSHQWERRRKEKAWCCIRAITGVTDETPDGEVAEWDTLPDAIKDKLNGAAMEIEGKSL